MPKVPRTIRQAGFGGPLAKIANENSFLAQVLEKDLKVFNLNARMYDPLGRQLLSPDLAMPFAINQIKASIRGGLGVGSPGMKQMTYAMNPYQYGNQNPISWSDPSGNSPEKTLENIVKTQATQGTLKATQLAGQEIIDGNLVVNVSYSGKLRLGALVIADVGSGRIHSVKVNRTASEGPLIEYQQHKVTKGGTGAGGGASVEGDFQVGLSESFPQEGTSKTHSASGGGSALLKFAAEGAKSTNVSTGDKAYTGSTTIFSLKQSSTFTNGFDLTDIGIGGSGGFGGYGGITTGVSGVHRIK